ncbi:MAG: phosphatidate cytidylyltransferase [Clostridia bacterium]|nr:phosphatidate cytidylyltransferase [Clostridia bacterium]
MVVRIISAVAAIPLLLFFVIVGGVPLKCAVLALSLIGMYELYKAVSGKIKAVHLVGFILEVLYFVSWFKNIDTVIMTLALAMATIAILFILVVFHKTNNIHDGTVTLFGFFYLGVLLSLICPIRDNSIYLVWMPFIFAFVSDTGAYFIGSKFGKHKLTPELSPKKSVEGAIGGVVSTAIVTAICALALDSSSVGYISLFAILGAAGSVIAQFGDLAASSIKRYAGIKDYGKLMPGHGGVLDRFDSVLFTLPYVYLIWLIMFFPKD